MAGSFAGKKRTTVEYALKDLTQSFGVTTCKVSPKLPRDYKKYLPSPETVIKSLDDMFSEFSIEK